MQIIEFLQQFSNLPLDWLMRFITEFGDIMFFIVLGVVLFWCIDKQFAYKLMSTLLFSATINGAFKFFTNKNRPYEDGAKPILQETEGSSMPSGHSQNIATASTMMIKEYYPIKWVRWPFIALVILVPFSRMYLGQHYLDDVIVGIVLGVAIGVLGIILYAKFPNKEEYIGFIMSPIVIILMILIPEKQVFVGGGAYLGLVLGYYFEKKYVQFDVKASLKVNILKVVIGLVVALILLEGLKVIFNLFGEYFIFVAIRYFLVAAWASLGAPALFKKIFKQEEIVEEPIEAVID